MPLPAWWVRAGRAAVAARVSSGPSAHPTLARPLASPSPRPAHPVLAERWAALMARTALRAVRPLSEHICLLMVAVLARRACWSLLIVVAVVVVVQCQPEQLALRAALLVGCPVELFRLFRLAQKVARVACRERQGIQPSLVVLAVVGHSPLALLVRLVE